MTHTASDGAILHIPSNLSVRQSYDETGRYQVSWGQGSQREEFVTDSPDLAACLVTMPTPLTTDAVSARLITELELDPVTAADLISDLISIGYLTSTADSHTAGERFWRDVEWDDALDFHVATRNMIWSHDYSGNPKIMTRYHVEQAIQPDSDPPTRYSPNVLSSVALPEATILDVDFRRVARKRRTSRDFRNTSITLQDLSTLLSWTFKPQFPAEEPRYYTSQSYSVGAPFAAFVITGGQGAPDELEQDFAVYHYAPEGHRLGLVKKAEGIDKLDALLWRQSYVNHAPVMLVVCADWRHFSWKYRFSRAYRFVYVECGAFMHTALLVGTALGLRTFPTPAIDDQLMCETLDVCDHEVGPIYMAAFGRPANVR